MDLSTQAKKRRDLVEAPLWRVSKLIDVIEEVRTRIDAAVKVWPEIGRTLHPALRIIDAVLKELTSLKQELSALWQAGFEMKWK